MDTRHSPSRRWCRALRSHTRCRRSPGSSRWSPGRGSGSWWCSPAPRRRWCGSLSSTRPCLKLRVLIPEQIHIVWLSTTHRDERNWKQRIKFGFKQIRLSWMKFGSDTIYTVGLLLVKPKIENILDTLRLILRQLGSDLGDLILLRSNKVILSLSWLL